MRTNSFITYIGKELKSHGFQYLFLATIGVFFLLLLNLARFSQYKQFMVLMLFVFFYMFWGVVHHITEKTFRFKIMLEYVLIGALVLILLQLIVR